jgi:tetratricopeptide (TPR) repeat protein
MRIHALLLLLLPASTLLAQQAPPAAVSCSVEAVAPTDGSRALAAERYADAETFYAAQMKAKPSITAYAGLVDAQIQLDKVDQALSTAKDAVAALPNSAEAEALLGDAKFRASEIDDASAAYSAALKIDRCTARAYFGIARIDDISSMHLKAQKEMLLAHHLAITNSRISEAYFATLPPAIHAKGLRNLLASATDLSPAHRQHLDEQASLLERDFVCTSSLPDGTVKVPLVPLLIQGDFIRDFGLKVVFNEKDSANLELDSTVSGIVLSETEANRLKVTPAVPTSTKAPYLGYVESITVANLHYANCPVHVVPDGDLGNGEHQRYSVIGTDFFRNSLISITWVAKEMTLSPRPGPSNTLTDAVTPATEKGWARVYLDGNRILLPTSINKKMSGLFLLDTAYAPVVLSPSTAAAFRPAVDNDLRIVGVSGPLVRVFLRDGGPLDRTTFSDPKGHLLPVSHTEKLTEFGFAGNAKLETKVYSFDIDQLSHRAGVEINGLFGFHTLREYFIDIDYTNGLVRLKWDQAFFDRPTTYRQPESSGL